MKIRNMIQGNCILRNVCALRLYSIREKGFLMFTLIVFRNTIKRKMIDRDIVVIFGKLRNVSRFKIRHQNGVNELL